MKPQTHCRNGHLRTPENVLVRADGRKDCRTCRREQAQRRYDANFRGHQHTHRVRSDRKELA